MNTDDPLDESFAELLAAHENGDRNGAEPTAPPELKARLDDALRCVQLLQQMWPQEAETPSPTKELPGERYRLRHLHATGGVGQVWLAEDADLGREVAVKELLPHRATDATFAHRFLQEARITARLQHPGIVPVYELVPGEDGKPPFYSMRFVSGRTLTEAVAAYHQRLRDGKAGPLELNGLLTAFVSVCNAVAYAHAQDIIHRDLKTANVVLGDFGEVVLIDWGFAQELDTRNSSLSSEGDRGEGLSDAGPGHTLAGQIVGTPAYMAPEQAAGRREQVGRHTDVYGLGAILYEILTGRPPFVGTDTVAILRQARTETPPDPEGVGRNVPAALAAICKRALAREPEQRYASATDLARDVERWLADEPVSAHPDSWLERGRRWSRRHRPWVVGAASLLLTAFAALMISLVLLEREQARTAETREQATAEKAAAEAKAREQLESHLYVKRLALAERELAAHNLARASRLLAECPAERRGWEWKCLQRQCQNDLLVLRGHTCPVSGAVFTLDGTRLVSAGHDGSIKMWDAATGREVANLQGHDDVIHCLAASTDGRRFASGSWDGTVKVWDARKGDLLKTLGDHPGKVLRVLFVPDTPWLAAASYSSLKLWDVTTGKEVRTIKERSLVYGLAASPDGTLLAIGTHDNVIRLCDPATGQEVQTLRGHTASPKHLAFSPDGKLLAAGDGDTLENGPGAVKIWDVASGKLVADLEGHIYPVYSIAFSPDGRRLFTGSQDSSIKVWDVASGQLMLTLRGHGDVVRTLRFSPDGLRLASASSDRTVCVWDASPVPSEPAAKRVQVLAGHADHVIGVGFVSDGRRVVSLDYDCALKVWDAERGTLLRSTAVEKGVDKYHSLAASPRGSLVALGNANGAALLIDTETGTKKGNCVHLGAGPVLGLAFNGDGTRLAVAEFENTVRVWDVEKGREVHVLKGHREPVIAVAFSQDGRLLASGGHDQTVILWDAQEGTRLHTLTGHTSGLHSMAFRSDGTLLASGANDGLIKLWDPATGKPVHDLRGHTGAVSSLAFSADGRRLYSASDDWTIKEWDVEAGTLLRTYHGHTGPVRALALTPKADRFVSGSHDHTVRLWQVRQ
jgi:WD40 repeat protein/serine/threonine protein kinase